jgi:hypothetical protein
MGTSNTISGTVRPGQLISIYETINDLPPRNVIVRSVWADATGHWEIALPNSLTTGTHSLYVASGANVVDKFEVVDGVQTPIGTTPPTPPTDPVPPVHPVDPIPPGDSNDHVLKIDSLYNDNGAQLVNIPYGSTTDDAAPLLRGTAAPNAPVDIYDTQTGKYLGGARADENGHWEAKVDVPLREGQHDLYVNSLGQHSESFSIHVQFGNTAPTEPTEPVNPVDPTPPADPALKIGGVIDNGSGHPPIDVPEGGNSGSAFPLVYGTARPGALVSLYDQQTGTFLGSGRADGDGHWEAQVVRSLAAGEHNLYVSVLGQYSEPFHLTVQFGAHTQTESTDLAQAADAVHPIDTVHSTDTSASTHAVDAAAQADHTLTIDGLTSRNLGLPAYEVGEGGTANSVFPTLHGTAQPNVGITIYDAQTGRAIDAARSDENGHWEVKLGRSLPDGHNELYATSVTGDRSETFQFNVDVSYHPSNAPQLQDVLADDTHALFGQESQQTQAQHADVSAKLDTHDLGYTQPGGVHADVATHASHALVQHEEVAHHG